ncbi:glycerol kinase GlpK [Lactobacillus sp. S2-2]|uniref:glycerol kinase GlpK n=1 Tax=Lactobacillus sp. S2-2 TaxID=2692917 RepID=UPI001F0107DF|nr:glycerol kinase GlpK [Lactobacillus sp. S2-2]MCF6515077.1 glycerol kinase GlpK [Lactobacillus sp. S2-2]
MNNKQYIISIDEGTTSSRAVIIDHEGKVVGKSQKEFDQIFPKPGWVEHDANEIWNTVQSVISDVLIKTKILPYKLRGIGITNQRETTVLWNKKTGEPVYNAIVWQSKQTSEIADKLKEDGYLNKIHQKTGLIIDSYFSATKIKWILDNVSGVRELADEGNLLFGTIDTWILWKLTKGKVHATDYTNASRTMLFNINNLDWDNEILEILNIPKNILPKVHPSSYNYGYTEGYTFQGVQIPIAGIAGDQQAALFGQHAFEPGMTKNTYGTGAFIVMNIGEQPKLSEKGLLTTIAYGIDNKVYYALEGSIFAAGSAIQWLRDGMKLVADASESEEMAFDVQEENNLYVVPAFTGLGAPYWNQEIRGSIFGLNSKTDNKQFVKATLESLAYQTKDVINTMKNDTNMNLKSLSVDGGAARNNYLMQFQADILGNSISRFEESEITALGVSYLAGLSVGFWNDLEEIKNLTTKKELFENKMTETKINKLYNGWKLAVESTEMFK